MSLKFRIAAIIFVLETIVLISVLMNTLSSLDEARERFANNEKLMLANAAEVAIPALEDGRLPQLQPYLDELSRLPQVVSVWLVDPAGLALASSESGSVGRLAPAFVAIGERHWMLQDLEVPGASATLAIEFSSRFLATTVDQIGDVGIITAAAGMAFVAVVGLMIGQMLTRRLQTLTVAADKIARGDISVRANVGGGDDVGRVADSLDLVLKKVRESEQRFKDFSTAASDWFWETDDALRYTWVSDSRATLFGLSQESFLGLSSQEVAKADTTDERWRAHLTTLSAHEPFMGFVYEVTDGTGASRPIEESGKPIFDEDGQFIGYRGVGRDLTAKMAAAEDLRTAQERLAGAVDSLSDCFSLYDADDKLILCNRALRELYAPVADTLRPGVRFETFLRAAISNGILSKGRSTPDVHLQRRMSRHRNPSGPFEVEHADGRWFLVSEQRLPEGGCIIISTDITDRKEAQRQIDFLAHHDGLTELPNRALFHDRLAMSLAQAKRTDSQVAVLLINIDNFRHVNDSFGPSIGDLLLKEVARRLRECGRVADTIARLDGDEFAVIQGPLESAHEAAVFAEKIIASISEPMSFGGDKIIVDVSVGVTLYPTDATEITQLVKNADIALSRAKQRMRGTYEFYADELGQQARSRIELAAGIRDAIDNDEFYLQYQPKVSLHDGRVVGAEALVRWRHPQRGEVSPSDFVAAAESSPLILEIGEWVAEEACRQIAAWTEAGVSVVPIAINASGAQFYDQQFLACLRSAVTARGIDPALIEIEITETALMNEEDAAVETMTELVKWGHSLSIDDFGTGYSSLAYLGRFPVGKLKIDRAFVTGLPDAEEQAEIVRAVVRLGHGLGMKVLAEGVETDAQAEFLKSVSCDEAQGFFFGRPLDADDFAPLLVAPAKRAPEHEPEPV